MQAPRLLQVAGVPTASHIARNSPGRTCAARQYPAVAPQAADAEQEVVLAGEHARSPWSGR